jgi:hypothetical protein
MSSNRLFAVALSAVLSSAHAQAPTNAYKLHIERQPLVRLLNEFSKQTGLQVIGMIDAGSSAGTVEAGSLIGQYTAEAALNELRSATGLAFRIVNGNTIAVMSPTRVTEKNAT